MCFFFFLCRECRRVVSGCGETPHTFLILHSRYRGRLYGGKNKKSHLISSRGVWQYSQGGSRWKRSCPHESRLDSHLLLKEYFAHDYKFSGFFYFLTFCDTLKWSRLNTSWPWDSSPAARLYSSTLHFFFFLGLLCGLSYSTSKSSLICISCIVRAQMADPRDSFWWKAPESSGSISHTSLRLDLTLWTVLCTKELRCRDGFLFLTDTQPEDTSVTSSAVHQSAALPPNGSA